MPALHSSIQVTLRSAAGASSALAASGAPESGPRTSAAVALSEDFTSAATLVGSSFAAGFLGTDLETFLAGFALGMLWR